MAQDRDTQTKLRAEISAFAPERAETIDDLRNWPLLRNVLLEAMRLYPPVPHLMRGAIETETVCGETVAKGAQVWISPWVLHRHRKFWQHPTAFMPERFAGQQAPWVQTPGYIPFAPAPASASACTSRWPRRRSCWRICCRGTRSACRAGEGDADWAGDD